MMEMRWIQKHGWHGPWVLQYRYRMPLMIAWHPEEGNKMKLAEWTNWIDVPYVPEP